MVGGERSGLRQVRVKSEECKCWEEICAYFEGATGAKLMYVGQRLRVGGLGLGLVHRSRDPWVFFMRSPGHRLSLGWYGSVGQRGGA